MISTISSSDAGTSPMLKPSAAVPWKRVLGRFASCAVLAALSGCGAEVEGPELAHVTGTVMVRGQPLPDAIVTFIPSNGRPSKGVTDNTGEYALIYTLDIPGAMIGEHSVMISPIQPIDAEAESTYASAVMRILPPHARDGSLKKSVRSGGNRINIEL